MNTLSTKWARNIVKYGSIGAMMAIACCIALMMLGYRIIDANSRYLQNSSHGLQLISLPDFDIFIEGALDGSYDPKFASVNSIPKGYLDNIRKYSVFLINKNSRPIAAYTIKWEFMQADGKRLISHRTYIARQSFKANDMQQQLNLASTNEAVKPKGGRKLVSLIDQINWRLGASIDDGPAEKIQKIEWNRDQDNIVRNIDFINERFTNRKSWSATIDLVIFTDGGAVGKDTLHNLERIKAKLDGERDVYERLFKDFESLGTGSQVKPITRSEYSGLFTAFENSVNRSNIIANREDKTTHYKWRQIYTGNAETDSYNDGKISASRNILLIRNNAGEEKAIEYISSSLKYPRVHFYKEQSYNQRSRVW